MRTGDMRQSGSMTVRRDRRPSQVRPRPPSDGRPKAAPVRRAAPATGRLVEHRSIERSRGLPLAARLLLVLAVVALGAAVLLTSSGLLGDAVGGLGGAFGGVVGKLTPATPTPSPVPVSDPPVLIAPTESYTNQPTVEMSATAPSSIVGGTGYTLRIYQLVKGQSPALRAQVQVGATTSITIPAVPLQPGVNDFEATIAGPGGESEPSAVVTYVLDKSIPKLQITSPKNGGTVNASSVTITGKTQARTSIVAHNAANGLSATASAANDGTFTLTIQLAQGSNQITVSGTDPAGNTGSSTLTVLRGSGQLTVTLSASTYRYTASKLPQPLTLTAVVTDPDGKPIANAPVTFTLSIPGIQVLTQEATTDATGTATFTTSVPKGATAGNGLATVLYTPATGSSVSARTAISVQ